MRLPGVIGNLNSRLLPLAAFVLFPWAAAGDDLTATIDRELKAVEPLLVQWRRDFHCHPEISNREERTAKVVGGLLTEFGVDRLQTGVARHGVVALIQGKRPGPTVALRADMDALPIQERTNLSFASRTPGVMHACGHDMHTAMLLGAARILCGLRIGMAGNVKLLFQPSEEGAPPGERGGAAVMIEEGVLADPPVAAVFGLHVHPEEQTGTLGYREGGLLASVDRFRIRIRGKQSHGATPWAGVDPVAAAAHVVVALQTIVSRRIDAREPAVVSVCMIQGGRTWNVIPEHVDLEGTIRCHHPAVRSEIEKHFRPLVEHTAAAHGATAEVNTFEDYAPAVWNDPALARRMRPLLADLVGEKNVLEIKPLMVGEDFALYAQKVPGLFLMLGTRNESIGAVGKLHTPDIVLDEGAMPVGVKTLVWLALGHLQQQAVGK